MKILQVNCVFRSGSTGRLTASLQKALCAQGEEGLICYGRGKRLTEPGVYKISSEWEAKLHSLLSRLFSVDFGYSPLATRRLLRIIRREKPDVVHLHCLNGHFVNVYRLLCFLKKQRIPTILTLHAEIMHTAGCEHAETCEKWLHGCSRCKKVEGKFSRFFRDDAAHCFEKMRRAVNGFEQLTVVGVSDWLTDRVLRSPVFQNIPCVTIPNGVDTNSFRFSDSKELRQHLGLEGKKLILHVTPNFKHPIKGGRYVLELAERMPDCYFIIVGFNGAVSTLPTNVLPIAHTQDKRELAAFYAMADVTLLTSRRETFSMVCSESLCCGTPVAGFLAGGPESIAVPEGSSFVPFADVEGLERQVRNFLQKAPDKSALSHKAQQTYSEAIMAKGYLSLYREMVGE